MKKKLLALGLAAILPGCVTVDGKGLSVDGSCIVCLTTKKTGSSTRATKDNIVVRTEYTSPLDVDSTYAVIKSEFKYKSPDEFHEGNIYTLQDSYKYVTTPGSYYYIRDPYIRHQFNGKVEKPILGFELIKRGSKTKIKQEIHYRISDNDVENKQLMDQLSNGIKQRTLRALR